MKALLIDDERLALVQLERMLRQTTEVTSIESFQNPLHAVEQAAVLQPDIIFLDIHMPEISGLQAAELLSEVCPLADIVFVTAHDEYAVQAFELNAMDYVLKPLQMSRLQKTMDRLTKRRGLPAAPIAEIDHTQKINCFKMLKFQSSGQQPELPKWRTAKAQELFAYLLHHRGQIVHKSTLLEVFYPEMDLKRAMTQLYTAIYQIRQCIQKMNMNISIHNSSIQEGYILDIGQVVLITELWEQELSKLSGPVSGQVDRVLQLLADYEGDYLQDYGYIWAEYERERLRQLWLILARQLGAYYLEDAHRKSDALQIYERIQAMDPYNEEEALIVMRLYDELGYYDKVTAHYERLLQSMEKELGIVVPQQVNLWYKKWQGNRNGRERMQ
ncbi:response regulator [Paenibacillus sp. FJAT-27812]|uniref:response regulator n=1 Tax=Paenibacillus sp. FJAT-27812 TaxID=1684143 RepID=UPI0006A78B61|nr:response regulator [Paenibacillus sp. FJAT-27812]